MIFKFLGFRDECVCSFHQSLKLPFSSYRVWSFWLSTYPVLQGNYIDLCWSHQKYPYFFCFCEVFLEVVRWY